MPPLGSQLMGAGVARQVLVKTKLARTAKAYMRNGVANRQVKNVFFKMNNSPQTPCSY